MIYLLVVTKLILLNPLDVLGLRHFSPIQSLNLYSEEVNGETLVTHLTCMLSLFYLGIEPLNTSY